MLAGAPQEPRNKREKKQAKLIVQLQKQVQGYRNVNYRLEQDLAVLQDKLEHERMEHNASQVNEYERGYQRGYNDALAEHTNLLENDDLDPEPYPDEEQDDCPHEHKPVCVCSAPDLRCPVHE